MLLTMTTSGKRLKQIAGNAVGLRGLLGKSHDLNHVCCPIG